MGHVGTKGVYSIPPDVLIGLQPILCKAGDDTSEDKIYCKRGINEGSQPAAFKIDFSFTGLFSLWNTPSSIRFCDDYTTWFETRTTTLPEDCSAAIERLGIELGYKKNLRDIQTGNPSGENLLMSMPPEQSVNRQTSVSIDGFAAADRIMEGFKTCLFGGTNNVSWIDLLRINRECTDGLGKYHIIGYGKGLSILLLLGAIFFRKALFSAMDQLLPPIITKTVQSGFQAIKDIKDILPGRRGQEKFTGPSAELSEEVYFRNLSASLLGGTIDPKDLLALVTNGPDKVLSWTSLGFDRRPPEVDLTRFTDAAKRVLAVAEKIAEGKKAIAEKIAK